MILTKIRRQVSFELVLLQPLESWTPYNSLVTLLGTTTYPLAVGTFQSIIFLFPKWDYVSSLEGISNHIKFAKVHHSYIFPIPIWPSEDAVPCSRVWQERRDVGRETCAAIQAPCWPAGQGAAVSSWWPWFLKNYLGNEPSFKTWDLHTTVYNVIKSVYKISIVYNKV